CQQSRPPWSARARGGGDLTRALPTLAGSAGRLRDAAAGWLLSLLCCAALAAVDDPPAAATAGVGVAVGLDDRAGGVSALERRAVGDAAAGRAALGGLQPGPPADRLAQHF